MAFDATEFAKQFSKPVGTGGFQAETFASQFGRATSRDLDTSEGLYNLAIDSGLQKEADRIKEQQSGERTKEIFSGGFISDAFDALNALQYGVVGLLKGKTFNEGVKTRQSFTDQDALGDKGIPGVIAGLALDIAFDPLTYIAPFTVLKKIPAAVKIGKAAKAAAFGKRVTKTIEGTTKTFETLEGGSKTGKYLASKFSWMFGADPIFKETFERSTKNIVVQTQNTVNMAKNIARLTPKTAAKILTKDEIGRFFRTPLPKLKNALSPDEFKNVSDFYNRIDSLGAEAVDLGLLSKGKFEENIGKYIKGAFEEFELMKKKSVFGRAKIGIKGIKARKQLTTEQFAKVAAEKGQIDNPAYLLFKSAFDLTKDVENAKLFRRVNRLFGTDVAQEGFKKLPKGIKLGDLSEKYVPNNMAEYLNEIIKPSEKTVGKQLVANFKFFKVIMNPATHARNIVSNKILNWWKLGMNPLDPRVISAEAESLTEIAKKGGKWIDEARPHGYNIDTFAAAEMKGLLDSPEVAAFGKKTGGLWQKVKKNLGDVYQAEENQAKLSSYIFNRKHRNLKPEEAWKAAESATFNYAQVTPFVRKMRESLFGFPFITFTVKATPVVAETAVKAPHRISAIGKIKQSIENLSDIEQTDKERASEPPWVKEGFYIKLPMKDKEGRSAYFDLTYILPFGDLLAGNFLERAQLRETGTKESLSSAALRKSPFINLVSEMGKNQDFFGNKIWKDSDPSDKQLGDLLRHVTKTYAPPLVADQLPGGYNKSGERTQRGFVGAVGEKERPDQRRTLMQELLRTVGAKVQPIDVDIQESFQEWNTKKGLETLLRENQVGKDFNKFYIPKQ